MMKAFRKVASLFLSAVLLLALCAQAGAEKAPAASREVADASQMTTVEDVVEEGMVPIAGEMLLDGDYAVAVDCSSSMFRIVEAVLHVSDGKLTATITMSGTSYLYVFPGTAAEAAAAEESTWIGYTEDSEGRFCFNIPVDALDAGVPCAAYSRNKELWYDRTLLFRADSLPTEAFREGFFVTAESLGLADGDYLVDVSLSGGSGKAKLASPATLHVENGSCTATLVWGSRNYDYMRLGETKYLPLPDRETSTFEIPVEIFDRNMAVIADTVAMSEPHEIEYRLLFSSASLQLLNSEADSASEAELCAAEQFRVDFREDGSALLTLGEKERYLLLDREAEIPADAEGLTIIRTPVERVYAASSSVPDLFLRCGALDRIRFTSTAEFSWRLPELQEALQKGSLLYAGKYNAPNYELLLEENCDLVIENTMIFHKPEVREKLEALDLPVIIEYSSYEPEPLGRVEWIRLYGLLTGHQAEADAFFQKQREVLEHTAAEAPTGKTAAFFHIASNGAAVVRRSSDYVTKMIELAGGRSPFTELPEEDNALSTVTIQMESFYAQARDADVLIYNSTVSGDLERMQDLLAKSSLFEDFKAVQSGEVWCTEQSMFQQSSATAGMIADIHTILSGEADGRDQLTWLHRIR
ncbi:MAG: ABC transporter substrate-binding protein [Oscillospiraceae bacterium]|nr:ABC transporter substrate-binding protein [Oscillospiraceae bacterium]